ncbi:MAG TPA: hypothetical protein VN961_11360 [Streptosporangiaceae bacterium]|nr:hypothetical protein [Streptosporangiaceae bacterium]
MAAIEQARWMLRLEAIYIEEVDGVCELTPTGEVGAIAAAHYLRIGSRLKEPSPDSELDDRRLTRTGSKADPASTESAVGAIMAGPAGRCR